MSSDIDFGVGIVRNNATKMDGRRIKGFAQARWYLFLFRFCSPPNPEHSAKPSPKSALDFL